MMQTTRRILKCSLSLAALFGVTASLPALASPPTASPEVTVFATGLNNPRGLKFGPRGFLYVAEAGVGGLNSTVGQCEQVPPPLGPVTGSEVGSRISRISPEGQITTVVDNLPSCQATEVTGGSIQGVVDITFMGHTLYALLAGAGCSHGVPGIPNGILRVNADGTTDMIADLSTFYQANPVAHPNPHDFEPDGTPYSMVHIGSTIYAVEPNHGELDRIDGHGRISRVIDLSATQGHVVPTSCVVHDGDFYVGTLTPFPAHPVAKVYRVTRKGELSVVVEGLTTVLGLAFHDGDLYVLETSAAVTSPGPPIIPGTGRVLRVGKSGAIQPVVTGLTFPTAMTFGPAGDLFISNFGFGFPPGSGQVLRVHFEDQEQE